VCDGLASGRQFLAGERFSAVDLLDISVCPQGCAFGAGQPKLSSRHIAARRFLGIENIASMLPRPSAWYILPDLQRLTSRLSTENEFVSQMASPRSQGQRRAEANLPIVAYGSTTGHATRLARLIASVFSTASVSMNRLTIADLLTRTQALFVCSSHGDVEFPENAKRFAKQLADSSDDLSALNFAVLALTRGGTADDASAGGHLDALLQSRGANPLLPLTTADTLTEDQGDAALSAWAARISDILAIEKTQVGTRRLSALEARGEAETGDFAPRPRGYEIATIVEVNLLSPENVHPAMNRIAMKLPDGLTYEMGDQITILPRNEMSVVESVIAALQIKRGLRYSIGGDAVIPGRLTIQQLFLQYLDLHGLPPRNLLRTFFEVANKEGRAVLAPLIDEADDQPFRELCVDTSVAECICQFAPYGVPSLDSLLSAIPRMEPRIYAISSAPESNPGHMEILVLEVLFGKNGKRGGLATHFLVNPLAKTVPFRNRRGAFRFPDDPESPMIMCALGSGLSPMLALLQRRQSLYPKIGPALLFAGVRFQSSFPLLFRKIAQFSQDGVLTAAFQAVSREPPKTHVQDLFKANTEKIWELWQDHRTYFYFCGPKRGCVDELKEIMLSMTITEGWLSSEEAMAFNIRHEWCIEEG
jgi:sulfite reductase alpha subunit-like flavoprotein